MSFSAIEVEGNLLPYDLIERIAAGDGEIGGLRPTDFGLERLADEMQTGFADLKLAWDDFQHRLERARKSRHVSVLSATRDTWAVPFFEILGFNLRRLEAPLLEAPLVVGGDQFRISHRAGAGEEAPPINIVSFDLDLSERPAKGARSAHAEVQEYLNRTDVLWGIVTNGRMLRLLRKSMRIAGPTYIEFDLTAILQTPLYNEFTVLFRLLHSTRFPSSVVEGPGCRLEQWYSRGAEEGGRVRDRLREGVEKALITFGNAFLTNPRSELLRDKIAAGRLSAHDYYRQLLRLIYRTLFLMVAEERRLIFPDQHPNSSLWPIYFEGYSMERLRRRVERPLPVHDREVDLWEAMRHCFILLRENDLAEQIGMIALNGQLFGQGACEDLEGAGCTNSDLLLAISQLASFEEHGFRRRVNFSALDTEELGSVYESLLDFHPHVELGDPDPFRLITGSERKTTGSYYTPRSLVNELIQSALVPVVEERLAKAKTKEEREHAILSMRVIDPAAGSGHFLLAAARRMGRELARVRTDEAEPGPAAFRQAVRDVIRSCIYAVDKNPLAVDLCKVALWLEGHNPGLPLNFLDHHVRCGDSLVGVLPHGDQHTVEDVLREGIPDGAFKPVDGDDKKVASALKRANREQRENRRQYRLELAPGALAGSARELRHLAEEDERLPQDVQRKEASWQALRHSPTLEQADVACSLWTAAFFLPMMEDARKRLEVITTEAVWTHLDHPKASHEHTVRVTDELAEKSGFFHWPLEFPDVFEQGGFDVVLSNPPWELVELKENEWFAVRAPEIVSASTSAARKRLIAELEEKRPTLYAHFNVEKQTYERLTKFLANCGRYTLCGHGRINTYSVFAETMRSLISPKGRVGAVLPAGLATDETTRSFFVDLMETGSLLSFLCFDNTLGLFPGIKRSLRFGLITFDGRLHDKGVLAKFVFFAHRIEELQDDRRSFTIALEDLAVLNPNTRTCPVFRSHRDAELNKALYRRTAILMREGNHGANPWGISLLQGLFNMTTASGLFRSRKQLERDGWSLDGNIFIKDGEQYLPLYEGKSTYQFDHRSASWTDDGIREPSVDLMANPTFKAMPRYWVPATEVHQRLDGRWPARWLLTWHRITDVNTMSRSVIACIIPLAGCGDTLPLFLFDKVSASRAAFLLGCLNSFAFDYIARQKIGGIHLDFHVVKQLVVPLPSSCDSAPAWHQSTTVGKWIDLRALELSYTAFDLLPFAHDLVGHNVPPFRWDEERRFLIRCELDAAFFQLYGIDHDDAAYIMDTFPIVKRKDVNGYGTYRTRDKILEIYNRMADAISTGKPFVSELDPPPGDHRAVHQP